MSIQIVEARLHGKGIKPVRNGHPWIFRNAIDVEPSSEAGRAARTALQTLTWERCQPALITAPDGTPIGWGVYSAASRLAVRVLTRHVDHPPSAQLLTDRIAGSASRRRHLFETGVEAFRVLSGEADGVPGLVVDRFGPRAVCSYSGAFAWDNRDLVAAAIRAAIARHVVESPEVVTATDREMLRRDGVSGELPGSNGGRETLVTENGLRWRVFPGGGQKTGMYCDQRENRGRVAGLAAGARVLDVFAYHGGFGLNALARGAAHATFVDSSRDALDAIGSNAALQEVPPTRFSRVHGDAFQLLHDDAVPGGVSSHDLVILDPPKLVKRRADLERGLRGYKDLNRSVIARAAPATRLATFSCSGAVGWADFQRTVAWAAGDAGRTVRIIGRFGQPADHPIPLAFPEAEYLKGLLLLIE